MEERGGEGESGRERWGGVGRVRVEESGGEWRSGGEGWGGVRVVGRGGEG